MATAEITTVVVTQPVEVEHITLTITKEEADTIANVFGLVSTPTASARREHVDGLLSALRKVGVQSNWRATFKSGYIRFTD